MSDEIEALAESIANLARDVSEIRETQNDHLILIGTIGKILRRLQPLVYDLQNSHAKHLQEHESE